MEENKNKNNIRFKSFFALDKKSERGKGESSQGSSKESSDNTKKSIVKTIGPSNLVILLMVGVLLLILSWPSSPRDKDANKGPKEGQNTNESTTKEVPTNKNPRQIYAYNLEDRLEAALRKVEGIGDVDVMITLKGSKEVVVLKDLPYTDDRLNESDGQGGSRITSSRSQEENTILIENEDGSKTPYILKELEPQVEGILVIATGGNKIEIIEQIIDAAQVLFGVPAHKIKVMKMS